MPDKHDLGGGLLLLIFAALVLLLIIFFSPLIILILKIVGALACLILGLFLLLFIILGIVHIFLIPYYAIKEDGESDVYEGTYRIEDAIDPGEEEKRPRT